MDESPGHMLRVFCMFSLRKVRRRTFPLELRISFTESASVFQNGNQVGFVSDSSSCNLLLSKKRKLDIIRKERRAMKGYNTENGYMGYVDGGYQLFASEADYLEWLED